MHEARALAAYGCGHAPSAASPTVAGFLDTCLMRFDGFAGALAFDRGRVQITADSEPRRRQLRELRALARASGLSYLDSWGLVRARLRQDDFRASAALVEILAVRAASGATVRGDSSRLHLRFADALLVASLRRDGSSPPGCTLQLLGFRRNAHGIYQRVLGKARHEAAHALLHVLPHTLLGALEVTLEPPTLLAHVASADAAAVEGAR